MSANQKTRLTVECPFLAQTKDEIFEVFDVAAEKFIKREHGTTKLWAASQDWFMEEWGRDVFIALPGLLLYRGFLSEAKEVFTRFSKERKDGLIPNRITEEETIYNTADASLWFIAALDQYFSIKKDKVFMKKMMGVVRDILSYYQKGTGYERFGGFHEIRMDADSLIISPAQATWMDADPSGNGSAIVTPRNGKAVEINALWYAALITAESMEADLGNKTEARKYATLARKVKKSFNAKFWNEHENCCFDVIEGDPHSGALRPNQIIAASHGKKLLTKVRKRQVFVAVTRDLLSSGGLRTLASRDSNYKGHYDTYSPMSEKDLAYHQGTIWPWLMGPYCDALVTVGLDDGKTKKEIHESLKKVLRPLVGFCLESEHQSLPEVFSGDFPHEPGGTTSQAWSVGEVFRVLVYYGLV